MALKFTGNITAMRTTKINHGIKMGALWDCKTETIDWEEFVLHQAPQHFSEVRQSTVKSDLSDKLGTFSDKCRFYTLC